MSELNHPEISGLGRLFTMVLPAIGLLLTLSSCEPDPRPARSTDHIRMMDEQVISYNRQIVRSENSEIEDYIARHQWKMEKTPTGLRMMIVEKGNGKTVRKGEELRLKYSISGLNGNVLYTSDSLGLKVIHPGTSDGESGLQEALLLMNEGDHAKLVVPSHLAYGLLGDLKKIPAGACLVYDIEILDSMPKNR